MSKHQRWLLAALLALGGLLGIGSAGWPEPTCPGPLCAVGK